MAGVTTNGALALVAVLSMLVPSVRSAVDYSISAARTYNSGWLPAKATWYGQPNGAGPDDNGTYNHIICNVVLSSRSNSNSVVITMPIDLLFAGGACGFNNVNQYPLSAMTSCGNEPLFQDGAGCGTCYQVLLPRIVPTVSVKLVDAADHL
jgi:hypothetical protein